MSIQEVLERLHEILRDIGTEKQPVPQPIPIPVREPQPQKRRRNSQRW